MAITIDWALKTINVPKSDLTVVQLIPSEIYNLNIDWFRLQLKDLEDNEDGMGFLDTHRHNTEVVLSGLTYARVVEIINGYTITFEDGRYAVNLIGANSNIADVVNVNQVSVRSANSAGLITVVSGSGVTAQDKEDIANLVWTNTGISTSLVAKEAKQDSIIADVSAHRLAVENKIAYILGLSQSNMRIANPVYSGNNLTSSTLKIYLNSSDANNDTNVLKTYQMTATYDTNNLMLSYKIVEV